MELSSIDADGVNVYYDPTLSDDAYLADGTYALTGGGFLRPDAADPAARQFATDATVATTSVPLPPQFIPAGGLMAMMGMVLARRRRSRRVQ